MKKLCATLLGCLAIFFITFSQTDTITNTKLVFGLSAPELLHVGASRDLSTISQFGVSFGLGPTWGGVWPTLNAEHRLYFGRMDERRERRKWFFRQGITFFTADTESAISLSLGTDLRSKRRHKGWTIDIGAFKLFQKEDDRENLLGPVLRFQYYSYLKKQAL